MSVGAGVVRKHAAQVATRTRVNGTVVQVPRIPGRQVGEYGDENTRVEVGDSDPSERYGLRRTGACVTASVLTVF